MKRPLLLLVFIVAATVAWSDTLFVAAIAEPGGNGQSWNSSYRSLADGIAAAAAGDEIWVARGTYAAPTDGYRLKNGVLLYGGFTGSETLRERRDWYRNETILASNDGDLILVARDCDSTTRIDGFVLQGAQRCALTIVNGEPRVFNCHFRNNRSVANGAAIFASRVGRLRVEYCVFERNRSSKSGGAVCVADAGVDAKGFGPFFGQCHFVNNEGGQGGGLFFDECSGIPQVASCAFSGNKARDAGGAVASIGTYAYYTNCTFSRNTLLAGFTGSGLTFAISGGHIQNSIIWNGTEDTTAHVLKYALEGDTMQIRSFANCIERDFELGFWQVDPVFENADNVNGPDGFYGTDDDGLALSSFSSVRNGGIIDKFVNHRQHDIIGNPRLVGRKIDLGAYESQRTGRLGFRDVVDELRRGKLVLMYRHGKTDWDQKDPGPSPECFPGRNLIAEGREQCTEIGAHQRALGIPQGDAFTSPVCRCWETLQKMVGRYEKKEHWAGGGGATNDLRWADLRAIPTNGNRMISTHDAVCQQMFNPDGTGEVVTTAEYMEGDCLILRPDGDTVEVLTQWCSENWLRYYVRFPGQSTSVTSTERGLPSSINVTPTPAGTEVQLASAVAARVHVVDLVGREIVAVDLPGDGVPVTVDVSSWPAGVYHIGGIGVAGRIVVAR